jgi:predicted transcriptional regulator
MDFKINKFVQVLNLIDGVRNNHRITIDADLSWAYTYKIINYMEDKGLVYKNHPNKRSIVPVLTENGKNLKQIVNYLKLGEIDK